MNSHRWHDDYNKFKAGIKDLEVMLTNVIQLGFDNASSLVGRVELLEVPPHLQQPLSHYCLEHTLVCCFYGLAMLSMHDSNIGCCAQTYPFWKGRQLVVSSVTTCIHFLSIYYTALSSVCVLAVKAFQTMAKRESIKRAVERKTADFQRLFVDDLNMVKKQFDLLKRVPAADPVLPRYAGQATAALVLAKRVDHTWQALQVSLHVNHLICVETNVQRTLHRSIPCVYGTSMHCKALLTPTVALCPVIHFRSIHHVIPG